MVSLQVMDKTSDPSLAARARLGHHVVQLLVLHFPFVHHQHAHGHVFVRHAGWWRDVADAQVVDECLDDGVVRGMVAVVKHSRAVALAEAWVVHGRRDEVVAQAKLVEGEAEGVQLAAVLRHAGFAFDPRDVGDDGGGGGCGNRGEGRGIGGVFQSIQQLIFGL